VNTSRKQIRHALEKYESKVQITGRSSGLEMQLYEALAGVVRGRIIDEPPVTVVTTEELTDLPAGSVITSPLPDTESNVAEKTSDRLWMMTGEDALYSSAELSHWADAPFTVLRRGYGHDHA
jgi:hypothetical protein